MSSLSLSDVLVCVCKKRGRAGGWRQQPVFSLFISIYESLPSPSLRPRRCLPFLSLVHLSWRNLFISDLVRAPIRAGLCTRMSEFARGHQSRWLRDTSVIIPSEDKPGNQLRTRFVFLGDGRMDPVVVVLDIRMRRPRLPLVPSSHRHR